MPFAAAGQNRYEEVVPLKEGMVVSVTVGDEVYDLVVDPSRAHTVAAPAMGGVLERVGIGENLFLKALPVETCNDLPAGVAGILGRDAFAQSVLTIDREEGYIALSAPYKPAYMSLKNRADLTPAGVDIVVSNGGRQFAAPLDSLLSLGVLTLDFVRNKTYFELHETLVKPENPISAVAERTTGGVQGAARDLSTTDFLREVYDFRAGGEWKYRGTTPCVIDFWATWCAPCLKMGPTIEALAKEYDGHVRFYKVDVDNEREVAAYFNVVAIPLLVFIPMDGPPRPVLATSEEEIRRNILELLSVSAAPEE